MKEQEIEVLFEETFFDCYLIKVQDKVILSSNKNTSEIIKNLIYKHAIPEFAITKFKNFLKDLFDVEIHRMKSTELKTIFDNKIDNNFICNTVKSLYHETWNAYKQPQPQSDVEIFGNAYLNLVESGTEAMEAVARLELQFTRALSEKVLQRDMILTNLDEKHIEMMKQLEESKGLNKSSDINRIEQQFHQTRLQVEINWNSDITALREEQRRDFRNYVMNAVSLLLVPEPNNDAKDNSTKTMSKDPMQSNNSNSSSRIVNGQPRITDDGNVKRSKSSNILNKLSERLSAVQKPIRNSFVYSMSGTVRLPSSMDNSPWQESFTIHLGRQMRSTHNMRIISVDPFYLMSFAGAQSIDILEKDFRLQPEVIASRLNTALSLYSRNLTALVLLVDNRLTTYSGMKQKFAHLCESSTDFHFPQLENQLEEIRKTLKEHNQKISIKSKRSENLENGDVYVTCHSNLNIVTVVFHLVIDESSIQREIKFPSPIHNGIRNILRTCFLHDIFCVNIPLLMTYFQKDYMNASWCNKRVETILKAVKGALMELCTWKGRESRTIQFLVPSGLSEDMLISFSSLLTDYFQLSRAVK